VLALARRQLLKWADSQLQKAGRSVDPEKLTKSLDKSLPDLPEPANNDDAMDFLGAMGVSFSRPVGAPAWVQLTTYLGVSCGSDHSVYLYEWRNSRWNRRFTIEADDSRLENYGPRNSVDVRLSAPDARGSRIVMTISEPPFCMSVWHDIDIRLYRIDTTQHMLVEEDALANYGEDSTWHARLEPDRALVEFVGGSIDSAVWIRRRVFHYAIHQDLVRRIEPVALSAQDFVEEWLTRPWADAGAWSEPVTAAWHAKLHKDSVFGDFNVVQRCAESGEWQVGIDFHDTSAAFFSVSETAQYRFRMKGVSERPQAGCSGGNDVRTMRAPMPSLIPGK
jgi:hypothetical protein